MWKNYIKTAITLLLRNKVYSSINIFGLTAGLTTFLLIGLYIQHELSFDEFHPEYESIYKLAMKFDGESIFAANTKDLIPLIAESIPEIEVAGRMLVREATIESEQNIFNERGIRLIDPEILEIFSFNWLQGNPGQVLSEPFSFVITRSMADKYYGDEDPMGKVLLVNKRFPITITGVVSNLPDNTHLDGDFFTSIDTGVAIYGEEVVAGGSFDTHSYIRLAQGADIASFTAKMSELLTSRLADRFQGRTAVEPVRVDQVHFTPMAGSLTGQAQSMTHILIFSAIAFSVLLIACINFINLSTARANQRALEIGLRKSVGAGRLQLTIQFLTEAVFLSFLSTALALMAVEILLPLFNGLTGKEVVFDYLSSPTQLVAIVTLGIATGLVAGIYPACYLAGFKPTKALSGDLTVGESRVGLRNLLVVAQFSTAIALIIATFVIYTQMNYARNIERGMNIEQMLVLKSSGQEGLGPQWSSMKRELLEHPGIVNVTASMRTPGMESAQRRFWSEGVNADPLLTIMPVDFDFFETYGISLIAGRDFNENIASDRMIFPIDNSSAAYILSEEAANHLGWRPEEALGKTIAYEHRNGARGPVIGIAQDVLYESVRNSRKNIIYFVTNTQWPEMTLGQASIKLSGINTEDTLEYIDSIWAEFHPGQPLEKRFLSQDMEAMYYTEAQQSRLVRFFSFFSIVIACLGLHGLAAFTVEQRAKEIGVRKVFGGSVWSIVLLLTNDFSKLVLISNVIAWPLAYVVMERWLENFAYRIDLTPLVFIGSGLIALCIAWVTVGGTAAKAASAKPVLALRYE